MDQNGFGTGLTKVGIPGADLGLQPEDPTIADLLKEQGYVTGQFGKNHFGDRNAFLPTVHGFDEFSGNLYHLNAEDEPEHPDYPKNPAFRERFGPRGVLHCKATDEDDPTEEPRFGRVGKQLVPLLRPDQAGHLRPGAILLHLHRRAPPPAGFLEKCCPEECMGDAETRRQVPAR